MKKQTSPINVMVEKKLKEQTTEILEDLGLSMSMAITIYLKQIVRNNGLPFELKSDKKRK